MRIGFWTNGLGTGHIRRANAFARSLEEVCDRFVLHVFSPRSRFRNLLHPRCVAQQRPAEWYDTFVIDQNLSAFPERFLGISDRYFQFCKLNTELESPHAELRINRVSIESCEANRKLGLPDHGVLLDIDPRGSLDSDTALEFLSRRAGRKLVPPLGLVFANTWNANAAHTFVSFGIQQLREKAATVVVSSSHRGTFLDRVKVRHPEGCVVTIALSPIYPYFSCFDSIFCAAGYNSYGETQLLRLPHHDITYAAMFPIDQALRLRERPQVRCLGNAQIAKMILYGTAQ